MGVKKKENGRLSVLVPIGCLRKPKQPVAGFHDRRFFRVCSGQRLVRMLPKPFQCRVSWLFLSMFADTGIIPSRGCAGK